MLGWWLDEGETNVLPSTFRRFHLLLTKGLMVMSRRTITRAELSEAIYKEVGLSRNESADLLESVLDIIADTLVSGENVKLPSFGSFSIRSKGERIGRNPKTGEEVPILPRKVLMFRPSQSMKAQINSKRAPGNT